MTEEEGVQGFVTKGNRVKTENSINVSELSVGKSVRFIATRKPV